MHHHLRILGLLAFLGVALCAKDEKFYQDMPKTSVIHTITNLIKRDAGIVENIANYVLESGLLEEEDVNEIKTKMKSLTEEDSSSALDDCTVCTTVVRLLRVILRRNNFADLIDPLNEICFNLVLVNIADVDRRMEICNGSIRIQGPHVAAVITSKIAPEKICEFQNSCNLPIIESDVKFPNSKFNRKDSLRNGVQKGRSLERNQGRSSKGMNSLELKKLKEDSLKIVQLTDIHIDVRYQQGSIADCGLPICCLPEYGDGDAGFYGDYNCNIPPRTIELFLQDIATFIKPNLILYTGDISGSRVWDETLNEILNCTETLTTTLNKTLPGYTVYPTMGNHEMYPTNLYYKDLPEVVELTNKITDWWSPIAKFGSDQESTFKKAADYSIQDPTTGFRIITYNSQFMYTSNWYNVLNYEQRTEAVEMINFIESELKNASLSGEMVMLLGHHPPNSGDYIAKYAIWYKELIQNYSDIIVLQLGGHKHNDYFHLINDVSGDVISMMYLGSAVTAGGTKNPAARVYYMDQGTGEVVDYEQYYLDMKMNPDEGNGKIRLLYSAREEYGLPDLSPQSWSELINRMELDDTLFLTHYNHYSINTRDNLDCNANCRAGYFCNLRHITWQEGSACRESYQPPERPPDTSSATMIQSVPFIFYLTVLWLTAAFSYL